MLLYEYNTLFTRYKLTQTLTIKKIILICTLLCLLFSCKKDKKVGPGPSTEQHLLKIQDTNSGALFTWEISYNSDGRISGISRYKNNETPMPVLSVSYSGNEAILTRTIDNAYVTENTEIRIILDANGKALRRLQNTFLEFKGSLGTQRQYIKDTTNYEYDGSGFLTKTTGGQFDSAWFNPQNEEITLYNTKKTTTYSLSGGNVMSYLNVNKVTGFVKRNGNISPVDANNEETFTYEYTKQYPNKTDFTNTVILNEYPIFPFILYKSNKNIADKSTWSKVSKDRNGTVVETNNGIANYFLEFNSAGYVSGVMTDPANPSAKITMIYGN